LLLQQLCSKITALESQIGGLDVPDDASLPAESSKLRSWNEVVAMVKAAFPEDTSVEDQPESPTATVRPGMFDPKAKQPERLPWHPDVRNMLDARESEVRTQRSAQGGPKGPLTAGSFLKPSKPAPARYFKPLGSAQDMFLSRPNHELRYLSDGPLRAVKEVAVPIKEVEAREVETKECLVLQSHLSWGLDLLESVVTKLPPAEDQITSASDLPALVTHLQAVSAMMSDWLTTQVANAILVRRDVAFKRVSSPLPHAVLEDLRASPFLQENLFSIAEEHLDEAKASKKDRQFLTAVRKLQPTQQQPPRYQQKGSQAAAQPFRDRKGSAKDSTSSAQARSPKPHPKAKSPAFKKGRYNKAAKSAGSRNQSNSNYRGRGRGKGRRS
jgi:hypothetical protein